MSGYGPLAAALAGGLPEGTWLLLRLRGGAAAAEEDGEAKPAVSVSFTQPKPAAGGAAPESSDTAAAASPGSSVSSPTLQQQRQQSMHRQHQQQSAAGAEQQVLAPLEQPRAPSSTSASSQTASSQSAPAPAPDASPSMAFPVAPATTEVDAAVAHAAQAAAAARLEPDEASGSEDESQHAPPSVSTSHLSASTGQQAGTEPPVLQLELVQWSVVVNAVGWDLAVPCLIQYTQAVEASTQPAAPARPAPAEAAAAVAPAAAAGAALPVQQAPPGPALWRLLLAVAELRVLVCVVDTADLEQAPGSTAFSAELPLPRAAREPAGASSAAGGADGEDDAQAGLAACLELCVSLSVAADFALGGWQGAELRLVQLQLGTGVAQWGSVSGTASVAGGGQPILTQPVVRVAGAQLALSAPGAGAGHSVGALTSTLHVSSVSGWVSASRLALGLHMVGQLAEQAALVQDAATTLPPAPPPPMSLYQWDASSEWTLGGGGGGGGASADAAQQQAGAACAPSPPTISCSVYIAKAAVLLCAELPRPAGGELVPGACLTMPLFEAVVLPLTVGMELTPQLALPAPAPLRSPSRQQLLLSSHATTPRVPAQQPGSACSGYALGLQVQGNFQCDVYHLEKLGWEPMIEPWDFQVGGLKGVVQRVEGGC